MTTRLVTIEKASPACLDDVLEILSQANLPHDGAKEHFSGFLVARSGGGRIEPKPTKIIIQCGGSVPENA